LPLSTLNNGKGISPPEADEDAEFQIGLKNGVLLDIDISDAKTVRDLLNKINLHPENHQQMVSAEIALDKNSIAIVDNTQGYGTFTIIPLNNSQTLSDLKLLKKDGSLNKLSENKIATVIPENFLLRVIIGLFIALTVGLVIIGGIKRIGKVAGKVVPIMCATYVTGALIIIFFNYDRIPETFYLIFKHAFTPTSAVGGFAGATVLYTITWGVKRAVFSNEAGVGSAPIAHAAARTDEPVREGLVALLGPLIDTLILCTMTAFVIILTGSWQTGADSSILTKNAFDAGIPVIGGLIVTICLVFFSITTAISWSYYGDRCAEYLFGPGAIVPYRWIFVVALFIGAITEIEFVWGFSDITFGLMAFPNLIAIIALSDNMVVFFKDYFSRKHERTK
jgi:AGCS family alanine or glycine:cation symporter